MSCCQPGADLARAVLEQAAVGVHATGAGGQRTLPGVSVVMLTDGEDGPAGGGRGCDRADPVVGPCGQVDDRPVDLGESRFEGCRRANRDGNGAGTAHELGQPGRPDQIVRQDRDPLGQRIVSAR